MANFYTRTGDDGLTSLLGKGRVKKNDLRIEAVGTLDEVDAFLGMARSTIDNPDWATMLVSIQRDLYQMMAEISASPENAERFKAITHEKVAWLEEQVAALEAVTEVPREFIIPGDTTSAAAVDVARTVVRRAERRVAELLHNGVIQNIHVIEYLNRLSSFCFVLELAMIQSVGKEKPTFAKTK
ncbi:MAG: cob(I)yrinic acid a,c-diamide adenosyltransferase [Veillonellaceae bacterium]|nr:cob(I)yrinic acid a,c-diamide adenosyltransferase [Veillonellaceae bacterium]